jgi:CHAD domain-containing protein
MAESTHALTLATSHCLVETVSTSKMFAHLITQQQNKLLEAKRLAIRRKKAEAGSLGFLQLKKFQELKRSLAEMRLKVTTLVQIEAILSRSKSA